MPTVGIVRYGMGNAASVTKAFRSAGATCIEIHKAKDLEGASHIVLPGVGAFEQGMHNLRSSGLKDALTSAVIDHKIPALGICLGMQLMLENGTEPHRCEGLGWIGGIVRRMNTGDQPLPHNGWNTIFPADGQPWLRDLPDSDLYFIHSYACEDVDADAVAATVDYSGHRIAALKQGNIFATQFHPEKSQEAGLEILRRFLAA